ncbi:MAG TPA: hypothetical protein VGB55_04470, partial [Tepidisphaeraceae bacterium]
FTRPWLPAGLYLVVVLLGLSLPAGKRMDYLLPAYAPAAVLAAVGLVGIARRLCLPTAFCLLLPLLVSVNLAYAYRTKFHESKSHWSDHAVAFTDRVQSIVRNETVLVLVRGKHPLTTLLGRHQGSYLTPADLKAADWLILPEQPNHAAAAVSEPLPLGFEILESRAVGRLGLYRAADAPPLEKLIELQRTIATYSADENPYHAPGTGYRDE